MTNTLLHRRAVVKLEPAHLQTDVYGHPVIDKGFSILFLNYTVIP